MVLWGVIVTKSQLAAMVGTLIALALDDGSNIFKRIGKLVPGTGGRLRQFESVGGLGASIVVSLVEPDEKSDAPRFRSEEHTSELQSLMRISYAVFCLKKKNKKTNRNKE